MTTSNAHTRPHISAGPMRLVSGGTVLLLHVLVVVALLLHLHAAPPSALPSRSLVLLSLHPDAPAPAPRPVAPTRSFTPPAASLTAPIFTLAPREARGIAVPETPAATPPGASAPVERKNPQDLFSDQKKEEFRRFFKQQAAEDRHENAKAAHATASCNVFRKPGEQDQPDLQAANGITRNFVPAFGIGLDTPGDGKVPASLQACN